jgi:hypothetical protein
MQSTKVIDLVDYVIPNKELENHLQKHNKYPPKTHPSAKDELVKLTISNAAKKNGQKLYLQHLQGKDSKRV